MNPYPAVGGDIHPAPLMAGAGDWTLLLTGLICFAVCIALWCWGWWEESRQGRDKQR